MQCEEVKELLSAYIDGQLTDEELQAVQFHLEACDSCQSEAEELSAISSLLACVPEAPLPDAFSARLHEALEEEGKAIRNSLKKDEIVNFADVDKKKPAAEILSFRKKRYWRAAAGIAAAFVVGFLSITMYNDTIPLPKRDIDVQHNLQVAAETEPKADLDSGNSAEPTDKGSGLTGGSETGGGIAQDQAKTSGEEGSSQKNMPDGTAPLKTASAAPQKETESFSEQQAADDSGSSMPGEPEALTDTAPEVQSPQYRSMPSMSDYCAGGEDGALSKMAVTELADAINSRNQEQMKTAVIRAGKSSHVSERARVADKFYHDLFHGENVTVEYSAAQTDSSNEIYQLTSANYTLNVSLTTEKEEVKIREGILNYSYEIDQALKGENYTLKSYTADNEHGSAEFIVQVKADGNESTITFSCKDGVVNRAK